MTGIIITGHGEFASGVLSALKIIVGDVGDVHTLAFNGEDSSSDFKKTLAGIVADMNDCERIIILSDLVGGTPFKCSIELADEVAGLLVIGGVNLPIILELVLAKAYLANIKDDLETIIDNGKNSIMFVDLHELLHHRA